LVVLRTTAHGSDSIVSVDKIWTGKTAKAVLVAAVALVAVTALRAVDPVPIAQLRERTFDTYQIIRPRPHNPELPVRIVDLDEASLATVGQWPWPRNIVADLVKRLTEMGAAVIAFDVTFAEPDRASPHLLARALRNKDGSEPQRMAEALSQLPDNDRLFAEAISQGPVVLGFAAARAPNDKRPSVKAGFALTGISAPEVQSRFDGTATNLPLFDEAASGVGGLNLSSRDKSGIVRRVPMIFTDGAKVYPSLVSEALRVAQQQKSIVVRGTGASGEIDSGGSRALVDMRIGSFKLPLTAEGEVWVYFDHDRPERYVSAKDVLDTQKAEELKSRLEGHIIFIGTSAAGLHDSWPTPLGEFVPGVSVHAHATEQILAQTLLYRPDWTLGAELLATIVLGVLLVWLLLRLGARYATLVGLFIVLLGVSGSWLGFTQFGMLIDPVYPLISTSLTYFSVVGVLYVATDREKQFVRQAFGQYVAPELLAKIENAPDMLRLGGETRQITLMFMDVRDFTPISEGLTAVELVEFINRLLSPLSDTIQAELGTIDKYIGDAIMAFWNAPLDIPDHPVRACRAALKMRTVVETLNEQDAFGFRQNGRTDRKVRIGIGINTGVACVGNMGSERRFNYSAMGDVVNVTSRIESNCKLLGFDIVISSETAELIPGFALLEAGDYTLKGKSQALKLYALVGDERHAQTSEFQELARRHQQLLSELQGAGKKDIDASIAACRRLGGPLLTRFYDRLEEIAAMTDDAQAGRLAAI
jgi:adenylate cyclase